MNDYSVVSNSTPLIAFIKKNEIFLLKSLFNKIIIPKAVYQEIINISKNLDKECNILEEEIKNNWIIVKEIKCLKFPEFNLGKGENEAINMCFEINNPLLLIDEKKGRIIAKSLKIEILGTLGILALAKKRGLKQYQQVFDNLDLLVRSGFYLSSDVILSFLNALK